MRIQGWLVFVAVAASGAPGSAAASGRCDDYMWAIKESLEVSLSGAVKTMTSADRCTWTLTQARDGSIEEIRFRTCSEEFRGPVRAALQRQARLPSPDDASCFESEIQINYRPPA